VSLGKRGSGRKRGRILPLCEGHVLKLFHRYGSRYCVEKSGDVDCQPDVSSDVARASLVKILQFGGLTRFEAGGDLHACFAVRWELSVEDLRVGYGRIEGSREDGC